MSKSNVSVTFWIIAAIALLWNLMGVGNFVGQLFMTPEMLDLMEQKTPGSKALYESTPSWLKVVFGVATITGLLGGLLLLLRKKMAYPLFVISCIAVIIQMGYSMLASNAVEVMGSMNGIIFPLFVIFVSIFFVYYSRKAIANQWID